jgi:hypothetical protein
MRSRPLRNQFPDQGRMAFRDGVDEGALHVALRRPAAGLDEEHFDIRDAIQREKSLKRWPRQWKIELIERTNPEWFELFRGTGW